MKGDRDEGDEVPLCPLENGVQPTVACCTEEEEAKEPPFPLLIRRRGRSSGVPGRAFG